MKASCSCSTEGFNRFNFNLQAMLFNFFLFVSRIFKVVKRTRKEQAEEFFLLHIRA
jgi:hypothetical protein